MGAVLHKNNVILTGDFNAPDINWANSPNLGNLSPASNKLLEIIDHDSNQFVKEPTRQQGNTQNILDLALSIIKILSVVSE